MAASGRTAMRELPPSTSRPGRTGRRAFLAAGASLIGAGLAPRVVAAARAQERAPDGDPRRREDAAQDLLDEAYERIAARFPDQNIHASNHAAMVAEALTVLGHAEAIESWLDRNLDRFRKGRGAGERIDEEHWRGALGDHGRTPTGRRSSSARSRSGVRRACCRRGRRGSRRASRAWRPTA